MCKVTRLQGNQLVNNKYAVKYVVILSMLF